MQLNNDYQQISPIVRNPLTTHPWSRPGATLGHTKCDMATWRHGDVCDMATFATWRRLQHGDTATFATWKPRDICGHCQLCLPIVTPKTCDTNRTIFLILKNHILSHHFRTMDFRIILATLSSVVLIPCNPVKETSELSFWVLP